MPEPLDFRPIPYCGSCYRPISGTPVVIYGLTYHKSCWEREINESRYEAATDADYDALYEPEIGGEA